MNQRIFVGIVAFFALVAGIIGAIYIAPPSHDAKQVEYFQPYPTPRAVAPFRYSTLKNRLLQKRV